MRPFGDVRSLATAAADYRSVAAKNMGVITPLFFSGAVHPGAQPPIFTRENRGQTKNN